MKIKPSYPFLLRKNEMFGIISQYGELLKMSKMVFLHSTAGVAVSIITIPFKLIKNDGKWISDDCI